MSILNNLNSKIISNGILRAVGILAGIALILFFLYKITAVLAYIAIATVVSLIGRPIILFLRKRLKFRNTIAVVITMIILLGILFGTISMFIPLIESQGKNLALLDYESLEGNVKVLVQEIDLYFSDRNINILKELQNSDAISKLNLDAIPNFLESVFGILGSISVGLFSVIFISFFFLKDSKLLTDAVMIFVPDNKETRLKKSFNKIKDLLSRYFIGLVLQITILFLIYTIVLLIFGIENAIVIAFLCALLNLIPFIGPLIGGVLMLMLCMTSNLGMSFQDVILPKTIGVMIGYAVAQLIDNFVSQPLIFSNSVKSHPLEIFLIIIIGGLLFGVLGMVVAVPSYTAIKVIAKEFLSDNKIVQSITKDI